MINSHGRRILSWNLSLIDHSCNIDDQWHPVYDTTSPFAYDDHVYQIDLCDLGRVLEINVKIQPLIYTTNNILRYGMLSADHIVIVPFIKQVPLIRLRTDDLEYDLVDPVLSETDPIILTYKDDELYISGKSLSGTVNYIIEFNKHIHGSLAIL